MEKALYKCTTFLLFWLSVNEGSRVKCTGLQLSKCTTVKDGLFVIVRGGEWS